MSWRRLVAECAFEGGHVGFGLRAEVTGSGHISQGSRFQAKLGLGERYGAEKHCVACVVSEVLDFVVSIGRWLRSRWLSCVEFVSFRVHGL